MEGCPNVSPAGEVVETSACKLKSFKNVSCAVGSDKFEDENVGDKVHLLPSKSKFNKSAAEPAAKPKRKSRSTRRRLNALTNNASLHFSDTDSEGELILINPRADNVIPETLEAVGKRKEIPNPTISVTVTDGVGGVATNNEAVDIDALGGVTPNRSRRQSYVENLTDCDEIYSSDPDVAENNPADGAVGKRRTSLMIRNDARHAANLLRETDYEDFSNDEDDGDEVGAGKTIYVPMRADIFADFNGETITTKEGNGPFSIEVRNQLSFDEGAVGPVDDVPGVPDYPAIPPADTDSEDMDASDEEEPTDLAHREVDDIFRDLDVAGTSQIVVKNSDKNNEIMNHRLRVAELQVDDGSADGHTDVEDIDNE